jgi:hypothetical protein
MKNSHITFISISIILLVILTIYYNSAKKKQEDAILGALLNKQPVADNQTGMLKFRARRSIAGIRGCSSRAFWHGLFGDGTIQGNTNACIDAYL